MLSKQLKWCIFPTNIDLHVLNAHIYIVHPIGWPLLVSTSC